MKKHQFLLRLLIAAAVCTTAYLYVVPAVLAVQIKPIDLATIDKGDLFKGFQMKADVKSIYPLNPITGLPSTDLGDFVSEVYQKGDIFTYVFTLTLGVGSISEVNTQFDVAGLVEYTTGAGDISYAAGYEFEAGKESDFDLFLDDTDPTMRTLDWSSNVATSTQSFFFQSTLAPGMGGYNLTYNGVPFTMDIGGGTSVAGFAPKSESMPPSPVPEPATLAMMGVGLIGIGSRFIRRRPR